MEEKKKYMEPEAELVVVGSEDVIATSGEPTGLFGEEDDFGA